MRTGTDEPRGLIDTQRINVMYIAQCSHQCLAAHYNKHPAEKDYKLYANIGVVLILPQKW